MRFMGGREQTETFLRYLFPGEITDIPGFVPRKRQIEIQIFPTRPAEACRDSKEITDTAGVC